VERKDESSRKHSVLRVPRLAPGAVLCGAAILVEEREVVEEVGGWCEVG
jgi:hypothetical protein